MARQRTFFHKCHRCIYRGKAANWEPDLAPQATIDLVTGERANPAEVKQVELPARRRAAKAPAAKAAKPAKAPKGGSRAKTAKVVEADA